MKSLLCFLSWEWINIALEFTATAWVKLPRWFLAVVGVNLVTHPAFMFLIDNFGRSTAFVLACEIGIVGVETILLAAIYGVRRWRTILAASFSMNAVSYLTGVFIAL